MPDVGLSIVFYPQVVDMDEEDDLYRIVGIDHVESVDFVFEPAADGRVLQALSSIAVEKTIEKLSTGTSLLGKGDIKMLEKNPIGNPASKASLRELSSGDRRNARSKKIEEEEVQTIANPIDDPVETRTLDSGTKFRYDSPPKSSRK